MSYLVSQTVIGPSSEFTTPLHIEWSTTQKPILHKRGKSNHIHEIHWSCRKSWDGITMRELTWFQTWTSQACNWEDFHCPQIASPLYVISYPTWLSAFATPNNKLTPRPSSSSCNPRNVWRLGRQTDSSCCQLLEIHFSCFSSAVELVGLGIVPCGPKDVQDVHFKSV